MLPTIHKRPRQLTAISHLTALAEDITITVIIVAWRSWFGKHVRNIIWPLVPLKWWTKTKKFRLKCWIDASTMTQKLKYSKNIILNKEILKVVCHAPWFLLAHCAIYEIILKTYNYCKSNITIYIYLQTRLVFSWHFATKFASFCRRIRRGWYTLAWF